MTSLYFIIFLISSLNLAAAQVSSGAYDLRKASAFNQGAQNVFDTRTNQDDGSSLTVNRAQGTTAIIADHSSIIGPVAASNGADLSASNTYLSGMNKINTNRQVAQDITGTSKLSGRGAANSQIATTADIAPDNANGHHLQSDHLDEIHRGDTTTHSRQDLSSQQTAQDTLNRGANNLAISSGAQVLPIDGSAASNRQVDWAKTRDHADILGTSITEQNSLEANGRDQAVDGRFHDNTIATSNNIGSRGFSGRGTLRSVAGHNSAAHHDDNVDARRYIDDEGGTATLQSNWQKGSDSTKSSLSPGFAMGGRSNAFNIGHDNKMLDGGNTTADHSTTAHSSNDFDERRTSSNQESTINGVV